MEGPGQNACAFVTPPRWYRFLIWLALGLAIYFFYGRRHSRLQQGQVVAPEAELPEGRA